MNEHSPSHIYKFVVTALTDQRRADELCNLLKINSEIERTDVNLEKRLIRIMSRVPINIEQLKIRLAQNKFHLQPVDLTQSIQPKSFNVCIDGMTCRSCELTVERQWKKIAGVKKVDVNAASGKASILVEGATPSIQELQTALGDEKYHVYEGSKKNNSVSLHSDKRPPFIRLVGLFALVLFIGHIFSRLGLLKGSFAVGSTMSFGAILVLGLVAASSSCIAVTGGLLLSAAAKFNERYGASTRLARMRPVLLFVGGRVLSYTILGGLLGVVGSILTPSPLVTAMLIILAAVYMLSMGLEMLHIAPAWLKRWMPRMPKNFSHRIMDAEAKEHPLAPFGLGAATFFLPCGFTQALQLYAITTGSFATGASTLLAFALGTAPALLALGFASNSLKGKAGRFFFQFSGALVVVLGLWNIQNALAIVGYPLSLPSFASPSVSQAALSNGKDPNVVMEGNTQVVKMAIDGGYQPSHVTLQAGKPVRWEVDAINAGGCTSVLVSRQLGIQKLLTPGKNVFEFTPTEPGEIAFSCSMGMFRGSFTVLAST